MGMFNVLEVELRCPHCGARAAMEAEFRFGLRNLDRYRLGDRLRWTGGGVSTPRQRPEGGNYTGEAYAECPNCRRDFWLTVQVRDDVISEAAIDRARAGYVS